MHAEFVVVKGDAYTGGWNVRRFCDCRGCKLVGGVPADVVATEAVA